MKKTIIVFSLLFTICASKISYSEINETELPLLHRKLALMALKLSDSRKNLSTIMNDIGKIAQQEPLHQLTSYATIGAEMRQIKTSTIFLVELLSMSPKIKNDYVLNYMRRQIQIMNIAKEAAYNRLEAIITWYASIENKAALHLMDKVKENIRSLIKLFDETIFILEKGIHKINTQ